VLVAGWLLFAGNRFPPNQAPQLTETRDGFHARSPADGLRKDRKKSELCFKETFVAVFGQLDCLGFDHKCVPGETTASSEHFRHGLYLQTQIRGLSLSGTDDRNLWVPFRWKPPDGTRDKLCYISWARLLGSDSSRAVVQMQVNGEGDPKIVEFSLTTLYEGIRAAKAIQMPHLLHIPSDSAYPGSSFMSGGKDREMIDGGDMLQVAGGTSDWVEGLGPEVEQCTPTLIVDSKAAQARANDYFLKLLPQSSRMQWIKVVGEHMDQLFIAMTAVDLDSSDSINLQRDVVFVRITGATAVACGGAGSCEEPVPKLLFCSACEPIRGDKSCLHGAAGMHYVRSHSGKFASDREALKSDDPDPTSDARGRTLTPSVVSLWPPTRARAGALAVLASGHLVESEGNPYVSVLLTNHHYLRCTTCESNVKFSKAQARSLHAGSGPNGPSRRFEQRGCPHVREARTFLELESTLRSEFALCLNTEASVSAVAWEELPPVEKVCYTSQQLAAQGKSDPLSGCLLSDAALSETAECMVDVRFLDDNMFLELYRAKVSLDIPPAPCDHIPKTATTAVVDGNDDICRDTSETTTITVWTTRGTFTLDVVHTFCRVCGDAAATPRFSGVEYGIHMLSHHSGASFQLMQRITSGWELHNTAVKQLWQQLKREWAILKLAHLDGLGQAWVDTVFNVPSEKTFFRLFISNVRRRLGHILNHYDDPEPCDEAEFANGGAADIVGIVAESTTTHDDEDLPVAAESEDAEFASGVAAEGGTGTSDVAAESRTTDHHEDLAAGHILNHYDDPEPCDEAEFANGGAADIVGMVAESTTTHDDEDLPVAAESEDAEFASGVAAEGSTGTSDVAAESRTTDHHEDLAADSEGADDRSVSLPCPACPKANVAGRLVSAPARVTIDGTLASRIAGHFEGIDHFSPSHLCGDDKSNQGAEPSDTTKVTRWCVESLGLKELRTLRETFVKARLPIKGRELNALVHAVDSLTGGPSGAPKMPGAYLNLMDEYVVLLRSVLDTPRLLSRTENDRYHALRDVLLDILSDGSASQMIPFRNALDYEELKKAQAGAHPFLSDESTSALRVLHEWLLKRLELRTDDIWRRDQCLHHIEPIINSFEKKSLSAANSGRLKDINATLWKLFFTSRDDASRLRSAEAAREILGKCRRIIDKVAPHLVRYARSDEGGAPELVPVFMLQIPRHNRPKKGNIAQAREAAWASSSESEGAKLMPVPADETLVARLSKGQAFFTCANGTRFRAYPDVWDLIGVNEDGCDKAFGRSLDSSGGAMVVCCEHSACLGAHVIDTAETKLDVVGCIFENFVIPPWEVVYDHACNLTDTVLNRAVALSFFFFTR
jgi:hypothetical protein